MFAFLAGGAEKIALFYKFFIDPAPARWLKVVGLLPTPPRTLPSWIIKTNPSCLIFIMSLAINCKLFDL